MQFPVIGITTYQGKNDKGLPIVALTQAYVDALIQAGGTPLLIPSSLTVENCLALYERLDGILFSGGGDIALEYFDRQPHSRVYEVEKDRDEIEMFLVKAVIKDKKPFLGICRGIQLVNVALGGTLYIHIADEKLGALKHDFYPEYPRTHLAHPVKVDAGTHLANVLGETQLSVNSLHHQGVKDVPAMLRSVAYTPDGLVEGLELPDHPFGIAVQWHPEWLTDQLSMRRLFRAFVEASDNYR